MATGNEATKVKVNKDNCQTAHSECKAITVNRLTILLRQEGYHYEFVDKAQAQNYECMICLGIARPPSQTPSCHISCVSCWEDWKRQNEAMGKEILCPTCSKKIGDRPVEEDEKISRIIKRLMVYCENKPNGCKQSFECAEIEIHHKRCGYKLVNCDLACGATVMVKNLEHHKKSNCPKRLELCTLCDAIMTHHELQDHIKICPKQKTVCEYCGDESLLNEQISEHIETDCKTYPTYCSLAVFGCTKKIKRNELNEHHATNVPEHLKQLNNTVLDICASIGKSYGDALIQNTPPMNELPVSLWGNMNQTRDRSNSQRKEVNVPLAEEVQNLKRRVQSLTELTTNQLDTITLLVGEVKTLTEFINNQAKTVTELKEQVTPHNKTTNNHANLPRVNIRINADSKSVAVSKTQAVTNIGAIKALFNIIKKKKADKDRLVNVPAFGYHTID